MGGGAAGLVLCLAAGISTAAGPGPRGAQAMRALFAGRELSDSAHYTYRFGPDGALSGAEMGREVRGRWQATASGMCLTWIVPAGSREL
jgi:hypothetical protein